MSNYATGDVDLKIRITSEKDVTVEEVVREATAIWRLMRSRKITFGDKEKTDAFMDEVQKKHPEFSKAYPIVMRYICEMQEYESKAFKLWLNKIKNNPWKTEVEYLEAQADYVTLLFRAKKPRANRTEVNSVRTNVLAVLKSEHEKFKHYAKEFEREVTTEVDVLRARNMDELYDFATLAGAEGLSKAEEIRVESNITPDYTVDIDDLARFMKPGPINICANDLLS